MILCETFWKPSLADFAKQHKQTIYSVFLQVLFLCLVLCFQAPLPPPFLSFFHSVYWPLFLLLVCLSRTLSALSTPLHPELYQALGYGFGLRVTEVMDFALKGRKEKGGKRNDHFCSLFCPWCREIQLRLVSWPALLLWGWDKHSAPHKRGRDNVAKNKRTYFYMPGLVFWDPCMWVFRLPS